MASRWLFLLTLTGLVAMVSVGGYLGFQSYRASHPGVVDVQAAWLAVRTDPRDAVRWATLADAQAALDQEQAAERSYLTAVRLGSDDPTVYGRLGFLLYGHGRDQEALSALRQAQDLGAELPLLARTVAELESRLAPPDPPPEPEPVPEAVAEDEEEQEEQEDQEEQEEQYPDEEVNQQEPPSPGLCTVAAPRFGRMGPFVVTTYLDGFEVPLVVDTGASLTTLEYEVVEELGVDIDEERVIHAITATGPAVFPTARLSVVEIAGHRLEGLMVAVCEGCGGRGAGGLLGLDVQAELGVELDVRRGELRFVDCE